VLREEIPALTAVAEANWYCHLRCVSLKIVTVGNCGGIVAAEVALYDDACIAHGALLALQLYSTKNLSLAIGCWQGVQQSFVRQSLCWRPSRREAVQARRKASTTPPTAHGTTPPSDQLMISLLQQR
jgi:hypothetical protein